MNIGGILEQCGSLGIMRGAATRPARGGSCCERKVYWVSAF